MRQVREGGEEGRGKVGKGKRDWQHHQGPARVSREGGAPLAN